MITSDPWAELRRAGYWRAVRRGVAVLLVAAVLPLVGAAGLAHADAATAAQADCAAPAGADGQYITVHAGGGASYGIHRGGRIELCEAGSWHRVTGRALFCAVWPMWQAGPDAPAGPGRTLATLTWLAELARHGGPVVRHDWRGYLDALLAGDQLPAWVLVMAGQALDADCPA